MSRTPRVLVVIGTRPEGIKLAPVVTALRSRSELETRVALTGQHTHLMDQVLDVFGLEPDVDLGIMREGQDLYDVTHACLDGLRGAISDWRPDMVMVEGDTTSVFIGALAAFYERIRVAHVEAGLRSRDAWRPHPATPYPDPYPEEMLRRLTGVLTDVHFAPTAGARDNLLCEGVAADRVHVTGNTVVDALQHIAALPHTPANADLREVLESGARMVLVTAHRRESFGEPLRRAFAALRALAEAFEDVVLLYPVHPNPNVRAVARETLAGHPRIRLTDPLDYRDLVHALKSCVLVITDSGGIQEEAPSFDKPVLVLREVTERPEGVDAGIAALVGTDADLITGLARAVLSGGGWAALRDYRDRRRSGKTVQAAIDEVLATASPQSGQAVEYPNPYGDGHAAERIADVLAHRLCGATRRTQDWAPAALGPAVRP